MNEHSRLWNAAGARHAAASEEQLRLASRKHGVQHLSRHPEFEPRARKFSRRSMSSDSVIDDGKATYRARALTKCVKPFLCCPAMTWKARDDKAR